MPQNQKTKDVLSLLLRVALTAGLLIFLFRKIDIPKTVDVIRSAEPGGIFIALGLHLVIVGVILCRWLVFIRALGLKSPLREVARFNFIGLFGNLFLPSSIGGDLIKVLGLCRSSDQKPKVVASVILDRLSGFGGMVVAAIVSLVLGRHMALDKWVVIPIVIMTVVSALIVTVLFVEKYYAFCCRAFSFFPKIQQGLMKVHYDIVILKDRRYALYQAVGISWFIQILQAMVFYWVAVALHQEVAFGYFLVFTPLIGVASSVPSIGGLGPREAIAAFLLMKVGVPVGVGVSISLIIYLFMVLTGLAGGLVYLMTPGVKTNTGRQSCGDAKDG